MLMSVPFTVMETSFSDSSLSWMSQAWPSTALSTLLCDGMAVSGSFLCPEGIWMSCLQLCLSHSVMRWQSLDGLPAPFSVMGYQFLVLSLYGMSLDGLSTALPIPHCNGRSVSGLCLFFLNVPGWDVYCCV